MPYLRHAIITLCRRALTRDNDAEYHITTDQHGCHNTNGASAQCAMRKKARMSQHDMLARAAARAHAHDA